MFSGSNILITGGTGSFGKQLVRTILKQYTPKKLIIFSRDELKQHEMRQAFPTGKDSCLRYFIGDVRDYERLIEALDGVDYVVHAAALKQVPTAEYNPFEAIKTNVLGAQNIIRASIAVGVERVIAMSTDKAANPINLYGATKLCADKLFTAGNAMSGDAHTTFASVRYGNVAGSRGSVIPFFLSKRESGVLPITHSDMTRFSITLQQGVDFVIRSMAEMRGGEVFVPKLPSFKIVDLARVIAPDAIFKDVGIRPGEKLHEVMIPSDEAWHTWEHEDRYIIFPARQDWETKIALPSKGWFCKPGFSYGSGTNTEWLTDNDLKNLVDDYCTKHKVTA